MKLKTFLTGLKKSQEVLEALDQAGIDVDRLIGISNAQGPQAKIIKGVLATASGLIAHDDFEAERKRSAPKKKPKRLTTSK